MGIQKFTFSLNSFAILEYLYILTPLMLSNCYTCLHNLNPTLLHMTNRPLKFQSKSIPYPMRSSDTDNVREVPVYLTRICLFVYLPGCDGQVLQLQTQYKNKVIAFQNSYYKKLIPRNPISYMHVYDLHSQLYVGLAGRWLIKQQESVNATCMHRFSKIILKVICSIINAQQDI